MALSFHHFLNKFPAAKLPVTLSEENVFDFSRENDPMPEKLATEFIQPYEEAADEMTEYVPCLRIEGLKDVHAVVYWRAGLMNYQYILATYTKAGSMVDRRVLAGTFSDGNIITRSVARIDDDMSIFIMSGQTIGNDDHYDASQSTTIELELLPDGRVVELV